MADSLPVIGSTFSRNIDDGSQCIFEEMSKKKATPWLRRPEAGLHLGHLSESNQTSNDRDEDNPIHIQSLNQRARGSSTLISIEIAHRGSRTGEKANTALLPFLHSEQS